MHMPPSTPRAPQVAATVDSTIPARLDSLVWSRFHTLVVFALGITWILDGLEVTIAGTIAPALEASPVLRFTATDVGLGASFYLLGAVVGALFFGWLTDRLGRKKLFFITLAVYLVATAATAFSFNLASYCLFRFFTGAGIGGEYSAINSTIQEFVPARYRGRVDLVINGSFWLGAALGGGAAIVVLDPAIFAPDHGWRVAFFAGAVIGAAILFVRRFIPESPRWLVIHGRAAEAEEAMRQVEALAQEKPPAGLKSITFVTRRHTPLRDVFRVLLVEHRRRAMVGLALMASQAFFYNAIFFTYALVLTRFYGVPARSIGLYILPFAAGNFLGPLLLGPLFDSLGRRIMISTTYLLSGVLLAFVGWLFAAGHLTALTQTLGWMVIFFFASAAASSAYLTVGETFPLEMRALAIAIFYALGTGLGGVAAPALFANAIESGSRDAVFAFYLAGAGAMILSALLQAIWGVDAEGRGLEDVATPMSVAPGMSVATGASTKD
jgi:MFS family permease